jgi:hypothetical protein
MRRVYEAAAGAVLLPLKATEIEVEETAVVPLMVGVARSLRLTVSVPEPNVRFEYVSLEK